MCAVKAGRFGEHSQMGTRGSVLQFMNNAHSPTKKTGQVLGVGRYVGRYVYKNIERSIIRGGIHDAHCAVRQTPAHTLTHTHTCANALTLR